MARFNFNVVAWSGNIAQVKLIYSQVLTFLCTMQFEEETSTLLFRSSSTSGEKLWMCCEWCWWIYMCPRPSCRGCLCSDHRVVEMPAGDAGRRCGFFVKCLQVPREALEIAGTSINFRSGKFGYSICPFLAKVMPKFFVNFGMTLLKIGHMGYCD